MLELFSFLPYVVTSIGTTKYAAAAAAWKPLEAVSAEIGRGGARVQEGQLKREPKRVLMSQGQNIALRSPGYAECVANKRVKSVTTLGYIGKGAPGRSGPLENCVPPRARRPERL